MENENLPSFVFGVVSGTEQADPANLRNGVGILISDPVQRRAVEAASIQLELTPQILSDMPLHGETLLAFELIVADKARVSELRALLSSRDEHGEGILPAVIAVQTRSGDDPVDTGEVSDLTFDGVLHLPAAPGEIAAQLSIILYSHRAFARRYQDALEELHLNRRIFRSVTSGISVASATRPDLPLVYVNPAFEAMTGYSLEEVQGRNCRFLQGEDRDQPGLTLVREALRDQREVTAVLKNYRKDGTPFWNELSLSPIRNREGELTHFVGIQTDVTARVEFEAALRESEKLAAVGRLASSIAHEINNPLESVMNLIYLAQRSDNADANRQFLIMADQELRRVKLITSQSLRFYKQSTRPQAVRCTELINSVLDLYHSRLQNAHIAVELREHSTQSIVCMESEIRQVLNNLVSNAIDAMRAQGGGRLLVRTLDACDWRTMTPGVRITIADTGSGISPETMSTLYKAFHTTKGAKGTGLGLWISREIVERHHGRLRVRSCSHGASTGTVFELFLPHQTYQGLVP